MDSLSNKTENAYVFVKPYDVKPIEGYQPHKNKDVSKKFPNCCEFHKLVFKALQKKEEDNYPEFKKRFEKENKIELDDVYYKNLSNKIIKQVSYSEYFISQKIDSENWFQDIVHYIDHNIFSFGNPNSGCLWYLNMLRYYLEEVDKELSESKKKRIIEYLNLKADNKNSSTIQSDDSNPKLIYQTLKKWRSLIPFKVPDFDKIGDYKDWIIVTGIQDVNPYNGMIKINTITKSELVELLKNYTKSLIQMVDSTYLVKEGNTTKINEHHKKLTNIEYRFNKEKIIGEYDDEENSYVEILDIWLKNEITYIERIKEQIRNGELIFQNIDLPGTVTFKVPYNERQIEMLRSLLIEKKYISQISKSDFHYLFTSMPLKPQMIKLNWLKSRPQAHYFLRMTVFSESVINYGQVNSCILFGKGKQLDSNDKLKTGYIEIDRLISNLQEIN